ncbi:amidohydrolase family-domain-containing protein [Peziza echinospora]|nr:amidohydrolase family-domain-containing protein [Peziza echinospora]
MARKYLTLPLILPPLLLGILVSLRTNDYNLPAFLTAEGRRTHCYKGGVLTHAHATELARCFTVGKRSGLVLDVVYDGDVEGGGEEETVVIPGLWDGHGHVLQLGEMLGSVRLFGVGSVEETQSRLTAHLAAHPALGTRQNWLRGIGWDQQLLTDLPPGTPFPTAALLTHASPLLADKFIMLDRVDVHCVWVSPAVLALLTPDQQTTPPPGGTIPAPGVFCDNAMAAVEAVYPDLVPSRAKTLDWTERAAAALNKAGVVGVHDAGARAWAMEAWLWMESMGVLGVRINAMQECPVRNAFCPEVTGRYLRNWDQDSGNVMVASFGVKIFADGALGSYGAALKEPYTDNPGESGTMLASDGELEEVITRWYKEGYQVSTHCIGDRAAQVVVGVYARLLDRELGHPDPLPNSARRLRIEHAQIVAAAEQAAMKRLGILASVQPTHATSDSAYAEARLGGERTRERAYRLRGWTEGLPRGGRGPVLGSDFPVESWDPRMGIYAAVTRRDPYGGGEGEAWHPEETLTARQALEGFTAGVAYAGWSEGRAGQISPGSWADWVVLGYDETPGEPRVGPRFWEEGWAGDVRMLSVKETWVAGRKVYDAEEEERAEAGGSPGVMGWVQRVFAGSGI